MTGLTLNGRNARGTLAVALTAAIAAVTNALADDFFIDDGDVFALISAINAANANDEPDTIHLAENGHYMLTEEDNDSFGLNGFPRIESAITIEGNGAVIERSSEDGTPNFRFFFLPSGSDADLTLIDLTLNGGHSDHGGSIRNWGNSVTIIDSTISNSTATNNGGAIHTVSGGALTITGSTLVGNTADRGGAINKHSHGGSVTITGSAILDNVATGTGIGGGALFLEHSGTHSITGTTISGNSAIVHGGGIRTSGNHLTLTDCTVSGNSAGASGGGIWNGGSLTMTGTTFSDNTAEQNGGGLYASNTTNATNCTFSGNSAANQGGGILIIGTTNLTNCTVADNTATNGGGIYRFQPLNMSNSIVGYNTGGADVHNGFNDLGYNIVEDGGGLSEKTSMSGDPMLDALADNGGPTMTHALLPGSPAIGTGDCAGGTVEVDQRDVDRPQGAGCDIGSVEVEGLSCAAADINCDDVVNVDDLLIVLNNWGECGDCGDCPADITGDCTVNVDDLLVVLNNWG